MVTHVDAQIPRHAVEQAVLRIEPVAIGLPEGQDGQQRLQPGNIVIA